MTPDENSQHLGSLFCHVCMEEVEVEQEATNRCVECNKFLCARDAKIHTKKEPTHHILNLSFDAHTINMVRDDSSDEDTSSMALSTMDDCKQLQWCPIHKDIPINAFCSTCEVLICSVCAVETHPNKKHHVNLITKIAPEEKAKLEKVLSDLDEQFKKWEDTHHTHDEELTNELTLIENERIRMRDEIKQAFDKLRVFVGERQDTLNQNIDELCDKHHDILKKIIELKKTSVDYMDIFAPMKQMTGYELLDNKLKHLRQTNQALKDLKQFFVYQTLSELHTLELNEYEKSVQNINREVFQKLGKIVQSKPQKQAPKATGTKKLVRVGTIGTGLEGSGVNEFNSPWDVKVSRQGGCIAVSDYLNNRIEFFDLQTREHRTTLVTSKGPKYMTIDQDVLLFTCANQCVYKYDLNRLLAEHYQEPVWVSGTPNKKTSDLDHFNEPCGLSISHSKKLNKALTGEEEAIVLVCDGANHRIKAISMSDGKPIKTFGKILTDDMSLQFNHPEGIEVTEERVIVTESVGNRIQILGISQSGDDLVVVKAFGKSGKGFLEFNCPREVVFDKSTKNVIICDEKNERIQVVSLDHGFKFFLEGSQDNNFKNVTGACFDDHTGELYVVDQSNNRVQIFK